MRYSISFSTVIALFFGEVFVLSPRIAAQTYEIAEITIDDPNDAGVFPRALNASGVVVGFYLRETGVPCFPLPSCFSIQPFSWTAVGGGLDLGSLGGDIGEAEGIKSDGVIVGSSETSTGTRRAFLYEDGAMSTAPQSFAYACDLNRAKTIAYSSTDCSSRAINENGTVVGPDLTRGDPNSQSPLDPSLAGGSIDVNDGEQIVGFVNTTESTSAAFLWENGEFLFFDEENNAERIIRNTKTRANGKRKFRIKIKESGSYFFEGPIGDALYREGSSNSVEVVSGSSGL